MQANLEISDPIQLDGFSGTGFGPGFLRGNQGKPSSTGKIKILFVGEAVTAAHVVRPLVLAESLNPLQYEIYFF